MRKLIAMLLIILSLPVIMSAQNGTKQDMIDDTFRDLDWSQKETVENYVYYSYGKNEFSKLILEVIKKESSGNVNARNGENQVGLMQITPICAKEMNYKFDDVRKYPWINIKCGVAYLLLCYNKASKDKKKAYKYYNKGLYYELRKRLQ